jgi:hypothetical protein
MQSISEKYDHRAVTSTQAVAEKLLITMSDGPKVTTELNLFYRVNLWATEPLQKIHRAIAMLLDAGFVQLSEHQEGCKCAEETVQHYGVTQIGLLEARDLALNAYEEIAARVNEN